MNMKSTGGFTLVELIVVIAILAILAGVAVPAYSGYLKSAEKAGDITLLSSVKTGALAALATKGEVTGITVTEATLDNDGKVTAGATITATYVDAQGNTQNATLTTNTDFQTYVPEYNSLVLATGTTATWQNGEWTIAE